MSAQMLWDAAAIKGYTIAGSDGPLGTVSDFLFDDASWKMRWLVVDVGRWLSGRNVLIPVSALGRPDPASRQFFVKLTVQQIKVCPDIAQHLPVSRQAESDLYAYYGWEPYWADSYFGDMMPTAFVPRPYQALARPRELGRVNSPKRPGDPHLRSIEAIIGYHVHATDGEIGHVGDFLAEEPGWDIRYIKVDTKNWLPGRRVVISPLSISAIDWAQRLVFLDVDREKVRHSPLYDPSSTVDGAYDEAILTYYGIKWVRPDVVAPTTSVAEKESLPRR